MKNSKKLAIALAAGGVSSLFPANAGAQTIQWANAVDGFWTTAGNWNPANAPDGLGENAVLGFTTPYTVVLSGAVQPSGVSITNPQAVLEVAAGANLQTRSGGVISNGRITVFGGGCCTIGAVTLAPGASLSGGGRLVLENSSGGDAQLRTASGIDPSFIGPGFTVTGTGSIPGFFVNSGTIAGAAGTGPIITGRIENDATGKLAAVGFQRRVSIGSGTVVGGTLESGAGGRIGTAGNGFLSGSTIVSGSELDVSAGHRLTALSPGVTNNGRITVLGGGCCTVGVLSLSNDATLSGTGFVTLNNQTGGDAVLEGTGTATIGAGITVDGSGKLQGAITSLGTIGGGPGPGPVIQGTLINQGTAGIRVLLADHSASIGSGTVVGGEIETSNGGRVATEGNGFIRSVTLTTGSNLQVDAGNRLTVQAPGITLNGRTTVFGAGCCTVGVLAVADGATLSGTGFITLSNEPGGDAQLESQGTATIGPELTVNGVGKIVGSYANQGTLGSGSGAGPVIQGIISNTISGKLRATGSGQAISIGNGAVRGGTVESVDGGRVATEGNGFISAATITTGSDLHVDAGNRLTVEAPGLTNNGKITVFGSGCCTVGVLALSNNATISGNGSLLLDRRPGGDAVLETTNGNSDLATIAASSRLGGIGTISGRINVAGTIAPGISFGQLARPGNITMQTSAVLELELAGPTQDRRDSFVGAGILNLAGTLRVRLLDNYRTCFTYSPVTGGQVRGRFNSLDLPRGMLVNYGTDRVTLTYNPADFDSNGSVDFFDYLDFIAAFAASSPDADFNGDSIVDFFDYLDFVQAFATPC